MTKKMWWVRLSLMPGYEYGRWVPTGTTDRVEAEDYLTSYNSEGLVAIEWLLM